MLNIICSMQITQSYILFLILLYLETQRALDRSWMLIHELKLNDDKTEYIIFQSKHHDQKYETTDLDLIDFKKMLSDNENFIKC